MLHTVAYSGEPGTITSYAAIAAISDSILPASGNGLLMPGDLRVVAAYAGGTTLSRARINAASLLRVGYPSIRPIQAVTDGVPPVDPNFMTMLANAPLVRANESVGVDVVHSTVGTARQVALLWLADKFDPVPSGDSFDLRFTGTTNIATAFTWTIVTPTFDQSLPSGTYAVVGLEMICNNVIAARLVFPSSVFRPGVLGGGAAVGTARTHSAFYDGSFGVLGMFQQNAPPNLEVLTAAAASTQEGYLRVVRVGDIGGAPPMPTGAPFSATATLAGAAPAAVGAAGPFITRR